LVKLLTKLTLLSTILFITCNLLSYIIITDDNLSHIFGIYNYNSRNYLYTVIDKSNSNLNSDTVILGDSVGSQLYSNKQFNLSSSGATTLAGQYILLKNVLKKNKINKVYILCVPSMLTSLPNTKLSYNGFIKPFYRKKYYSDITPCVNSVLRHQAFYLLYSLPMAKVLPIFSLIDCSKNIMPTNVGKYDIVAEYISKFSELSISHNIDIKFICPPISIKFKNDFDITEFRSFVKRYDTCNMFSDYIASMLIIDDNFFREDMLHYNASDIEPVRILFENSSRIYMPI